MPLTPTARAGLLAAGLTLSLFAACGGIVAVAVLAGGGKGEPAGQPDRQSGQADRTTGQPLADRPVSEGRADDDESYVAGHRWWRKRMGKADLDRVVRACIEAPADQTVFVGRDGRAYTQPTFQVEQLPDAADEVRVYRPKRYRPDRPEVLRALRSALDAAEFRHGPGR